MNVIKNQRYAYEETQYDFFFEFNIKGEQFFRYFQEKQEGSFSQ